MKRILTVFMLVLLAGTYTGFSMIATDLDEEIVVVDSLSELDQDVITIQDFLMDMKILEDVPLYPKSDFILPASTEIVTGKNLIGFHEQRVRTKHKHILKVTNSILTDTRPTFYNQPRDGLRYI